MPSKKRILVVEDDPFIAMDIEEALLDAGFSVLGPVAVVETGLSLIGETKPDAATLDYNLGKENSLPIAKELDKLGIPYVILSGQSEHVIGTDLANHPQIIPKPYDPDHLAKVLREIVS